MGGNTRFGLVLAAACALLYGLGAWSGSGKRGWLIAAVLLLSITLTVPRTLEPLRKIWMRIGGGLHVVVSPLFLGLFYFTVVTPIGLGMRLIGKDPLRLRRAATTYWIERRPPGPEPRTMKELY